jgi:hypothetical protein
MPDRPYAKLLSSDLAKLISSCIQAGNRQGLLNIQVELRHRNSAGAKRLRAQLGKHLNPGATSRSKNVHTSMKRLRRLEPGEKSIFELERLADTAMHRDLINDVQDIASLLEDRIGIRANNLKNRITVHLWDQGLKPNLLPQALHGGPHKSSTHQKSQTAEPGGSLIARSLSQR